jgi:hypothetical protein
MIPRVATELYQAVFAGNRVQPATKRFLLRAASLILRSLLRGTRMVSQYIGNENDPLETYVVNIATSVVFPPPLVDPPKEWFPTTFAAEVPSHIDASETRDAFQDAYTGSMKLALDALFPTATSAALKDLFANAFGLLVLIRDLVIARGAVITTEHVRYVLESESLVEMFYPMLHEERELPSPSVITISNSSGAVAAGPSRAATPANNSARRNTEVVGPSRTATAVTNNSARRNTEVVGPSPVNNSAAAAAAAGPSRTTTTAKNSGAAVAGPSRRTPANNSGIAWPSKTVVNTSRARFPPPPPRRVPPPPAKIPNKIQFLNNLFGFNNSN